ncbi:MAG: DMT family transporter [Bacillota bacterium]|nr:DMT family transporter [Bacillota bacterium]
MHSLNTSNVNAKRNAMLLMAVCGVMWSLGGIFIKLISWSPLLIAGIRSIISALILGGYMLYKKVPINICKYSIGAGLGLSGSCICFVIANKLTTAANAIVLQYAAPVFILIISAVFLKQRLHKKEVIVVAITMVGIVLFFFDQLSPGSLLGNLFGILAGITLAIMLVMTGLGGKDDSVRMTGILIAHCLTSVIGTPIGLLTTTSTTGIEILYIVILGVFQLGIPYVLFAIATRDCPPLAASLIAMLEPLLNPVWVAIFVGELPGVFALLGAVIIIITVTYWCISDSESPNEKGQKP